MAKVGGGGGGGRTFAWTLLGFLAGIAATLGVQTLVGGSGERPVHVEAASGSVHITTTARSPPPKRARKMAQASAAPPARSPAAAAAKPETEAEVADDAAAVGMTSRVAPAAPAPADSLPAVSN